MKENARILKLAFPHTIPVMTGYLFLGAAFGILLQSKGYSWAWALLMSVFIYAGSMQFVTIQLLAGGAGLLNAVLMTLMVNARHLFYGLSMLGRFQEMGRKKPYMIFSLTDETFSLLCAAKAPPDVDEKRFFFFISLLDQLYWIAGSVAGAAAGSLLAFDPKGIDFVMTALFTVIFIDQWKGAKKHLPALTGVFVSLLCLLLFGPSVFMLPAMLLTAAVLIAFRKRMEGEGRADGD